MAAKSTKKARQEAPPEDDFDDDSEYDSDDAEIEVPEPLANDPAGSHRRDWRDVERYREARELRRLMEDDLDDL